MAFALDGLVNSADRCPGSDVERGAGENDELFGYHELEVFGWWDLSGADDL